MRIVAGGRGFYTLRGRNGLRTARHRIRNCSTTASSSVFANADSNFENLGLSETICSSLSAVGLQRPTRIQNAGIPSILSGANTVLASETGSGKTIAYLAPVVHMLKQLHVEDLYKPTALVLVPTQELVLQVTAVAQQCFPWMAEAIRPTYGAVGPRQKDQCSLLVATPKALRENIGQSRLRLLRTVVLDEADLLLTGEYAEDVTDWLVRGRHSSSKKLAKSRSQARQTVFCGATVPDAGTTGARSFIETNFPGAVWVAAGEQHAVSSRTTHKYCAIEVDEDKFGDVQALKAMGVDAKEEGVQSAESVDEHGLPPTVDPLALFARREALATERADCIQAAKLRVLPAALVAADHEALGLVAGRGSVAPVLGEALDGVLENQQELVQSQTQGSGVDKGPPVPMDRDGLLHLSEGVLLPSVRADGKMSRRRSTGGKRGSTSMQIRVKAAPTVLDTKGLTPIDTQEMPQTLIFCNTVQSANAALGCIRAAAPHLPIAVLHKKIGAARRQAAVSRFLSGELRVLVCTDIAARGLDTTAVGHVIQLDFASSAVSFLHRVGRTGRLGQSGRVTSLVAPEDAALARGIVTAQALGSPLDPVFSRRRSLRRRRKRLAARLDTLEEGAGVGGKEQPEQSFEVDTAPQQSDGARV